MFYEFPLLCVFKAVLKKVMRTHKKVMTFHKRYGFKQDGILRQELYKNGKYKDVIIMSILKEEFLSI